MVDPVERRAIASRLLGSSMYVGGEWVAAKTGSVAEHVDPATGEVQAVFPDASAADVELAVVAARAAAPGWRRTTADVRRAVLLKLAAGIRDAGPDFDAIAALEYGQPISAGARAAAAADSFEYYAGWCDKLAGNVVPAYPAAALDYTLPEPYGVVAAFVSWNGPITSIGRKIAPALAAGNTVVLKSSDLAPFAAQRFAQLCELAGIPPGVVNLVSGGRETGEALSAHRDIDKITFTGGGPTAKKVMGSAAEHLTPLLLELGGKSANIVFPDADLKTAASFSALFGVAANAGQGCLLPTRLLVHADVYDEVVDAVVEVLQGLAIGDPLDPTTAMGPVVSLASRDRILALVDRAVRDGNGRLLCGGQRLDELGSGFFIQPTVLADVDPGCAVAQEEVFGPVLVAMEFTSDEEALELANATDYGLAGYIHTSNLDRALGMAGRLDAGYVSVNGASPLTPTAPFGGFKQSGFGKENGLLGLLEFTRTKNVYIPLRNDEGRKP
jgi:aldehyde dehydrogenase (NAD+)